VEIYNRLAAPSVVGVVGASNLVHGFVRQNEALAGRAGLE